MQNCIEVAHFPHPFELTTANEAIRPCFNWAALQDLNMANLYAIQHLTHRFQLPQYNPLDVAIETYTVLHDQPNQWVFMLRQSGSEAFTVPVSTHNLFVAKYYAGYADARWFYIQSEPDYSGNVERWRHWPKANLLFQTRVWETTSTYVVDWLGSMHCRVKL
jgi:hypothetical protein